VVLNDGTLRIDVVRLIPVARVIDSAGTNYYINRSGKRMQASIRYSMDVPVITGNFAGRITPSLAFPLLDYLNTDPDMAALTSSINIAPNSDVILVPSIKGHVVNLGDSADLPNKMARLKVFYKKVMPVKGWEYYDTISVKWRGQVVARRRDRKPDYKVLLAEEHIDLDDEGTMLTTASADQN
ncbi:MAG: cell division protein FtsQ/DivIB, partial [Muribaculaceae bacterium]|nr:cell division protein FtsQ/DivIB [Muribaculaceae bacterium]